MSGSYSYVIIGHPDSKRTLLFSESLDRAGFPTPRVVSWRSLLADGEYCLDEIVDQTVFVRVDSPGRDFEVERLLLAEGADAGSAEEQRYSGVSRDQALALQDDHGLIRWPRQWYRGFCSVLRRVGRKLNEGRCVVLNDADDIMVMFDKPACHARLSAAKIPVPEALKTATCHDNLIAGMREMGWGGAFIKLSHGSSASGCVAYRNDGGRPFAVSTVEMVRDDGRLRLYNTRRPRVYTAMRDVSDLIDELCRHDVQVEAWLPKASESGRKFDLRVLVVDGKACHVVVRKSRTVFTNLHLLNERGDVELLRARMGTEQWEQAMETCERAAALFPNSLHAGVDLLISPDLRSHAILEVNAFGDLLPGVLYNGMSTQDVEIETVRAGWRPVGSHSASELTV